MSIQKILTLWLVSLSVILVAFGPIQVHRVDAQTAEKTWKFERWETDLDIQVDGSVQVTEDTEVQFNGTFSWYTRTIPMQGRMRISNISVFEGDTDITNELATIDDSDPKQVTITIAQASTDITRNYRITYTASHVIGLFADYDELYWNAISDDREVPIDELLVRVHLPQAVTSGAIARKMYVGFYGATDTGGTNKLIDNQTVEFYLPNVEPYTNATAVTTFPKGLVPNDPRVVLQYPNDEIQGTAWAIDVEHNRYPILGSTVYVGKLVGEVPQNTQTIEIERWGYKTGEYPIVVPTEGEVVVPITFEITMWYQILLAVIFAILAVYVVSPFIVFVWLFMRWQRMGKDPAGRGTIIPQYEPYKGMSPAMVGSLQDERVDMVDITASIIDLAIKGYLRIIEDDDKEISFERTTKDIAELQDFERQLLKAIFGEDMTGTVALENLKYVFHDKLAAIRTGVLTELTEQGYFELNPEKVRTKYIAIGVMFIVLGGIGSMFYGLGIPLCVIGAAFLVFSRFMPKRTKLGVEAKEWHQGYKMYLYHAERYRLQKMTIEHFEAALPYAMIFGVEKAWATQFKDLYVSPPDWYRSTQLVNNFTMLQLVSHLDATVMPTMQTTMSAVQPSSGSAAGGGSGFSGGFSGGGFGGGGSSAG